MNAEALASVSLRKTSTPSPSPSLLGSGVAEEKERHRRLRECDLEAWYDRLSSFTFPTSFLPLSQETATALMEAYSIYLSSPSSSSTSPSPSSPTSPSPTSILPTILSLLPPPHATLLTTLISTINSALSLPPFSSSSSPPSVFAKLSSRSPKDSKVCEQKALTAITTTLSSTPPQDLDPNTIFAVVMEAGIAALECTTGEEVVEMMISSDRVCSDDIPLALEHASSSWSQHLVLRSWVSLPPWCELRGFVCNGVLTGLSQYFVGVVFPELIEKKDQIQAAVLAFFDQVSPSLGLDDCVLDLALEESPDDGGLNVYIIEINPFGPPDGMGTGTGLFDLSDPDDAAILFGTPPAFEFRIQSTPLSTLTHLIRPDTPLGSFLTSHDLL